VSSVLLSTDFCSNVMPEWWVEKGERKQLQGKGQIGLVFVSHRIRTDLFLMQK
jgi:hypothetical protein